MQINCDTVIFIIGNSQTCFVFGIDNRFSVEQGSVEDIWKTIDSSCFLRINDYTIINSKFYVNKEPGRLIKLKGGSIHKVSRNSWKHFNDMPAED